MKRQSIYLIENSQTHIGCCSEVVSQRKIRSSRDSPLSNQQKRQWIKIISNKKDYKPKPKIIKKLQNKLQLNNSQISRPLQININRVIIYPQITTPIHVTYHARKIQQAQTPRFGFNSIIDCKYQSTQANSLAHSSTNCNNRTKFQYQRQQRQQKHKYQTIINSQSRKQTQQKFNIQQQKINTSSNKSQEIEKSLKKDKKQQKQHKLQIHRLQSNSPPNLIKKNYLKINSIGINQARQCVSNYDSDNSLINKNNSQISQYSQIISMETPSLFAIKINTQQKP